MQLKNGDKIVLEKPFGVLRNVGEVYTVEDVSDGIAMFTFGPGGTNIGYISTDGAEKYFTKQETKRVSVHPNDIADLIAGASVEKMTVFGKCTVVSVQLANGFVIVESSSCVDPANYDAKLGYEICMRKIRERLSEMEGYRLQSEICNTAVNTYDF